MLALITPTRGRWQWLTRQAEIVAAQLHEHDRWIVVCDNDWPPADVWDEIEGRIGHEQLVSIALNYARPVPPVACVNRARNSGAAMAPPSYDIVEVDDHDLLKPGALERIRGAFAAGADYVFGDFHQQALVELPDGRAVLESWPDVKHVYLPGGFTRHEIEAIGVRAIRRELWDRLGGWSETVWPCADYDFAQRAEAAAARIVCLVEPLCTVLIDPESLAANFRGRGAGGKQEEGKSGKGEEGTRKITKDR
ncbi:MAG TPA: glycosyltransferase family A protein [Pirellulales bacterium]|jgi:hypothetical protein|nr:glycosyltransferase family A protein [Pirellulales bacterium]